jgi:hypothetical protein
MPSRAELNLRAFAVGLDPATVVNDSKLEQRVLFLEKNSYAVTGTKPTTTLTQSGAAGDTETFTIGSMVYTMKTALTGVLANATLTVSGTPSDGDEVRIGGYVYVFKTTLDTGATLTAFLGGNSTRFQVLINGSAANAITNLKAAINATGTPGTDYSAAITAAAQYFSGGTATSSTLVVQGVVAGTPAYVGYEIATTKVGSNLSWSAAALNGGVNPVANQILIGAAATNSLDNIKDAINGTVVSGSRDVTVSSNTPRHPYVTAGTKTASTLVIASTDTNTVGALATTETLANGAFTGSTLASGVLGAIVIAGATTADSVAQVSGDKNTAL